MHYGQCAAGLKCQSKLKGTHVLVESLAELSTVVPRGLLPGVTAPRQCEVRAIDLDYVQRGPRETGD